MDVLLGIVGLHDGPARSHDHLIHQPTREDRGKFSKDPGDNTLAIHRTERASQSTVGFGDAELGVFG